MEVGSRVWVTDAKEGWVLATVEEKNGRKITAVTQKSREQVVRTADVDVVSLLGAEPGSLGHIDDLTRLPALNEAALLQTLHERFDQDKIYTWVGPILIAANPFKRIPNLYTTKRWIAREKSLPPHIYGLVDASFRAMSDFHGQPQMILVSGESGAGKTETTKHAMQYLTECSHSSGHSAKVLQANPLLECFGNAKTVRNDNSSRFGKLIEMRFSRDGRSKLLGASVTSYLLEKARIVHQSKGERNYHAFYEMFHYPNSRSKFKLRESPRHHAYLSSSGEYQRADVSDPEQLEKTLEAMRTLGFSTQDIEAVFEIVAGVLHLGDIEFQPELGGEACSISNPEVLKTCADLLGLAAGQTGSQSFVKNASKEGKPERTLADVLCVRRMQVQGPGSWGGNELQSETFVKMLTPRQAYEAKDALAMSVYERLFAWIVWRVNYAMEGSGKMNEDPEDRKYCIGLLDVFGFEVFEENFFEQLCINYCNEQLQRQFNEHVFELEQKMYEAEGVDWTFVEYPDNSPTIQMIESKPIGLLALLDEECMFPSGSDKSLHSKLVQNLAKQFDRFVCPQQQQRDLQFTIKHFAGDVTYEIEGFYRKNKNELRQDAVDLICESNKFLVRVLLPPDAQEAAGGSDASKYFSTRAQQLGASVLAAPSSSDARKWEKQALPAWEGDLTSGKEQSKHARIKSQRKMSQIQQTTVSSHFKSQLHQALATIRASQPSFVRCIKPNDKNRPSLFFRNRVLDQLRYSGVVEVIRVARAGYPTRFDLDHMLDRYGILMSSANTVGTRAARKLVLSGDIRAQAKACQSVCERAGLSPNTDFQVGKSKVFLRAEATIKLEAAKANLLKHSVRIIQRAWRTYFHRNRHARYARRIQKLWRGYRVRKRVLPIMEKRRLAAKFIMSSPNMRRWVAAARKHVRENPRPSARRVERGSMVRSNAFSLGDSNSNDMQQLALVAVPFAVLIGVPTLASSSPAVLGFLILICFGAAMGSFLVLDAQKNAKFETTSKWTQEMEKVKKKQRYQKVINAPSSPKQALQRRTFSGEITKPTALPKKATSNHAPVSITVNGEALKRFAGLAAARKEAMSRARQRAEDMLLAGELPLVAKNQATSAAPQNGAKPQTTTIVEQPRVKPPPVARSSNPPPPVLPERKPNQAQVKSAEQKKRESNPGAKQSAPSKPAGKPRADTTTLNDEEQYSLNMAILTMFLEEQAPDSADLADDLLKEFAGREETLFEKLTEEFPETNTNVMNTAKQSETPVWDRFINKRKSTRRHTKRGSRGFFGTLGPSFEEEMRYLTEPHTVASNGKHNASRLSMTTKGSSSGKADSGTGKKGFAAGAKAVFSKLGSKG